MKKFIKLDDYGQLYIDKIIFESYFPIVFTCLNDNRDIFVSVCCQNNEKGCKWLLGKTNGENIVQMLQDKITIRQLLEHSTGRVSISFAANKYTVAYNNSDWDEDSPYLPKIDSYIYAEDGEFEDDIDYFLSLNHCIPYNAESYKSIAQAFGTISRGIESKTEALSEAAASIEKAITVRSEIVNTLEVYGKLFMDFKTDIKKYTNQEKYESVYNGTFNSGAGNLTLKVKVENNNYYADAA